MKKLLCGLLAIASVSALAANEVMCNMVVKIDKQPSGKFKIMKAEKSTNDFAEADKFNLFDVGYSLNSNKLIDFYFINEILREGKGAKYESGNISFYNNNCHDDSYNYGYNYGQNNYENDVIPLYNCKGDLFTYPSSKSFSKQEAPIDEKKEEEVGLFAKSFSLIKNHVEQRIVEAKERRNNRYKNNYDDSDEKQAKEHEQMIKNYAVKLNMEYISSIDSAEDSIKTDILTNPITKQYIDTCKSNYKQQQKEIKATKEGLRLCSTVAPNITKRLILPQLINIDKTISAMFKKNGMSVHYFCEQKVYLACISLRSAAIYSKEDKMAVDNCIAIRNAWHAKGL